MSEHTHHKAHELAIFLIPADERRVMEMRVIHHSLGPMQRLVGGYITMVPERLAERHTPVLRCGCPTRLVVNEEAGMVGREHLQNPRASELFQADYPIYGDAFLVGEGQVEAEGFPEVDFISLPQEFARWKGPGFSVPKPPKILRLAEKNRK
jgi:hypothetical protein